MKEVKIKEGVGKPLKVDKQMGEDYSAIESNNQVPSISFNRN